MTTKFVIRNLLKRPFLHGIKIIGLGLALSAVLLIILFLKYELTFDSSHKNADNIFRLTTVNKDFLNGKHFARLFRPDYIPALAEDYPGITNFVRMAPIKGGAVKHEDEYFSISQGFECDSTFFEVFDAEFLIGDSKQALAFPGSAVISEDFGKRVFGDSDPIGQVITIPLGQYYGENTDYIISGIIKEFPGNSHFHPEIIAAPADKDRLAFWAWTYLLFHPESVPNEVALGFNDWYTGHFEMEEDAEITAHLQSIKNIHLYSHKTREIEANSNIMVVVSFSIAALILLFIALINYANLNMGMAAYNDKFLYINKLFGASGRDRSKFFLSEGIILCILTLIVGLSFFSLGIIIIRKWYLLDLFSENLFLISLVVFLFCIVEIFIGMLPLTRLYFLNANNSMDISAKVKPRGKFMNGGLIVFQNTIAVTLIVAVIVINRQTSYALENSMGRGENQLVCFEDVHTNVQEKFVEFKDELIKYSAIEGVSGMMEPPGGEANDMFNFTMEDYINDEVNDQNNRIGIFPVDYSFASVFDLNFLAGENFSEEYEDNEGAGEYLINESAMHRLNYTKPSEIIGKEFKLIFGEGDVINIPSGKIIGVVKDFNLSSLKLEIDPLVFFKRKDLWLINLIVSFKPGQETLGLQHLKMVWTDQFPEYPFRVKYVSSMYKEVYSDEILQVRLLSIMTIITFIICSMGLLGLSLLSTQKRIKEIGIRKVNGASTHILTAMLNWEYLKLIILSVLFAIPLSYIFMSNWLESYIYQTKLYWWIFALAGLVTIIYAFLTVSVQTWRISSKNPIETLRSE